MADNDYNQNSQNNYFRPEVENYQENNIQMPQKEDKASVGLAILSFIIPLVGLIVFLVDRDKKPKNAKTSGICALVSFLLGIVISIIITVAGGAILGSAIDDSENVENVGSLRAEETVADDGVLGDYVCSIVSAELTKDWEGNDAVLVTYEFTNNSSEASSFGIALEDAVYQDGISLELAVLDYDYTDVFVDIKPGATLNVQQAYALRDTTTPLEIEVSEWLSSSNTKVAATVELV